MVSAENIRGKKVIGLKGLLIGEVDGIDIDTGNWHVTHLRVSLHDEIAKQMGFRTGLINISKPIISLPVETIDQVGDVITIKDSIKEVRDLEPTRPIP